MSALFKAKETSINAGKLQLCKCQVTVLLLRA